MAAKRGIRTANAPMPAGSYSQGIEAGGFLYTAGFGPGGPHTPAIGASVGQQTEQTLRNIAAVLAVAGLTFDDIVKVTVHLQDLNGDFAAFDKAYASFFHPPYPVRTTVGSDLMQILVEIDVIAKLRD